MSVSVDFACLVEVSSCRGSHFGSWLVGIRASDNDSVVFHEGDEGVHQIGLVSTLERGL